MHSLLSHPQLQSCRRLFLKNYVVNINIGVHDFEQIAEQRVIFNVDLYIPLEDSTPKNDDLSEVVDYDFIRSTILERVRQGHIYLQETLCDDLAARLLAHDKVKAVQLSTQKPDVYPDCDAVGVEIFRIKA